MRKAMFISWLVLLVVLISVPVFNVLATGGSTLWEVEATYDYGIVVDEGDYNQSFPKAVTDGYGGSIISWIDAEETGGYGYNIYAQKLDANGNECWQAGGVAICTSESVMSTDPNVQIVSDGLGGAVIVWADSRTGVYKVFAQRVTSEGVTWSNDAVVSSTGIGETDPQVALVYCDDGYEAPDDIKVIVTWETGNYFCDIMAQMLDGSGNRLWADTGVVVSDEAGWQKLPKIVADDAGGAYITWKDNRFGNQWVTNYNIYALKINEDGSSDWTDDGELISSSLYEGIDPQIISDYAGGAIIAWEETRSGNKDIYAQKVDGNANLLWGTGVAVSEATDDQHDVQLCSDGNNGAFLVWEDKRGGSNYDIYAQRVDTNGNYSLTEDGLAICTATGGSKWNPTIVYDGSYGATIAWYDSSNVYVHKIHETRGLEWATNGVEIGTGQYPQLVTDLGDGAILVWSRTPNGSSDIYAQRTEHSRTWYFAEGSRREGLQTWICIVNPQANQAELEVTFMLNTGAEYVIEPTLDAQYRLTIDPSAEIPDGWEGEDFSTKVSSKNGVGVVAERVMYCSSGGIDNVSGNSTRGVTQPHTFWRFGEGAIGWGPNFEEWICIQNPTDKDALVTVTAMTESGQTPSLDLVIDPHSRETVSGYDLIQVLGNITDESFSAQVESTNETLVVAERVMYWSSGGISRAGSHCSIGDNDGSLTWYFAEGNNRTDRSDPDNPDYLVTEWVCIQNPTDTDTQCSVTFYKENLDTISGLGDTWTEFITVPKTSRRSLLVNDVSDVADQASSIQIVSMTGVPVIAERVMYMDAGDNDDFAGHCTIGAKELAQSWLLAEGCTKEYTEYVCISNPNFADTSVSVNYMSATGGSIYSEIRTIPGMMRETIGLNGLEDGNGSLVLANSNVSVQVTSQGGPIVVERVMYWTTGGILLGGGHCSIAVPE